MTTIETPGRYVSVKQAAQILGLKPWPVMQLFESGELPLSLVPGRRVIPAVAVRKYAPRRGDAIERVDGPGVMGWITHPRRDA